MKTKLHLLLIVLALLASVHSVAAQGTSFTYQGRLANAIGPVNGTYDVTYKLWNALTGGGQVGSTFTVSGTVISNGLFTATLDFGSVFNGSSYWLELAVRTNGAASYSTLSPRQELTPTPYAITAENVDGLVPAGQLSGVIPGGALAGVYPNTVDLSNPANIIDGIGAGLTGVNALQLDGLTAANFWQLTGNAGTSPGLNFIGTTDNNAFEVHVDGTRALRIETGAGIYGSEIIPNIIGGSAGNYVASGGVANVIAGGGDYFEGYTNYINNGNYNVIGGGAGNGITNTFGLDSTIAGGYNNWVGGSHAVVGGGYGNVATGYGSTIPGGNLNTAAGQNSFAAGNLAAANNSGSFVWSDNSGNPTVDTGANQFVVRATGGAFFYDGAAGVDIDSSGSNYGTIAYGINFGLPGSGEGIASQRSAGVDQYTLDFYTSYINRMTIANNGKVGINTTNPTAQLHIVSSTGPSGDGGDGFAGGPGIWVDSKTSDGVYSSVYGNEAYAFWGVATNINGVGGYFTSTVGTGVYASSGTGSALTIGSGAIQVTGAGTNDTTTAAFIHVATAANAYTSNGTELNNSLCNGDPNAILLVTPTLSPQGKEAVYNNHPIGVYYDNSVGRWVIFEQDNAAMPISAAFNVLIIKN